MEAAVDDILARLHQVGVDRCDLFLCTNVPLASCIAAAKGSDACPHGVHVWLLGGFDHISLSFDNFDAAEPGRVLWMRDLLCQHPRLIGRQHEAQPTQARQQQLPEHLGAATSWACSTCGLDDNEEAKLLCLACGYPRYPQAQTSGTRGTGGGSGGYPATFSCTPLHNTRPLGAGHAANAGGAAADPASGAARAGPPRIVDHEEPRNPAMMPQLGDDQHQCQYCATVNLRELPRCEKCEMPNRHYQAPQAPQGPPPAGMDVAPECWRCPQCSWRSNALASEVCDGCGQYTRPENAQPAKQDKRGGGKRWIPFFGYMWRSSGGATGSPRGEGEGMPGQRWS